MLAQPTLFQRVPEERRRHLSAAGGLPLALLEESRYSSRRFRKIRGLDALPALARAVAVDRLDLGFVDILSSEGALDHPLSGPQEELYWRRALLASTEPPRSRLPVVDATVVASVGATFDIKPRRPGPIPRRWRRSWTRSAWAQRAAVGLRGVRLRHLPAVRRGGGAGTGVDAAVHAVPGAPGRRGAAGGGGGQDDRALDLPGAAGPAGVRGGARASGATRGSRCCSSTSTGSRK